MAAFSRDQSSHREKIVRVISAIQKGYWDKIYQTLLGALTLILYSQGLFY
jgi:hypothetical protein